MDLRSIQLSNFRNHKNLSLNFQSRLIFFIGDNGEGKTNILESIHMFSTLKSFRDNTDEEVTGWGNSFYYLKCELEKSGFNQTLELGYTKEQTKKKKIKINGQEIPKKTDLIGELKCVVFSPVDLRILEGGPSERRRFLDSFLSSTNRRYIEILLEYNKVLKQRNALLKAKVSSRSEILPWSKLLADRGKEIMDFRRDCVLKLNDLYRKNLSELSGNKDQMELIYKPNILETELYLEKLEQRLDVDLRLGYTSKGIHRDDLFVGRENVDITSFGSQGQKRSSVISLKTAQYQYIKTEIGESPVLLIDDVIRELDVKRREYFVNLLMNCGQAFFTTTDLEGIKDYIGGLSESIQVFSVASGTVSEIHL